MSDIHVVNTIIQIEYVQDCANLFYQAKNAEGLSPRTLAFYQQQLGHFLKYCDSQAVEKMGDITAGTLREFLLWHSSTGHNTGGLHAAYRTVKVFLRWYELEAEPDNWKNPIRKVKAPRLPKTILEPAQLDDISKLIDTCDVLSMGGVRDKAILLFLLDTGTRARELTGINLADVNRISGEVIIRHGKGNKERPVFLAKTARKALRAYLKTRSDSDPALWVSDDGERLTYRGLDGIIKRRSKRAGIPPLTLHSFRRAFALIMLRSGVDIITLARLMGHESLEVLRRYLKQIPDDLRTAHEKNSPGDQVK